MAKDKYKVIDDSGVTFFFKYDPDDPEQLHIYVRHLTTIDDALETFFEGKTSHNKQRQRYETYTSTHGLYWFWLNQATKKVMIITCFTLEAGRYES